MWYVLADMYDGNRYVELFYGEELKDVAEIQNRSLSNLIETVLKEYVSKFKED